MKQLLIAFFLLLFMSSNAQITESFETDLSNWTGNTDKFSINSNKLNLNDNVAGSASLFTRNSLIYAEWEIQLQMEFAPSTSNKLKLYLAVDTNNTALIKNGYFLQLGENGSLDAFELVKITNGSEQIILRGSELYGSEVDSVSIKVIHQDNGTWQLYTDPTGKKNYVLEGSIENDDIKTSNYFGLSCTYTVTRSTLFHFQEVKISPYTPDTKGPTLTNYSIKNNNSIQLFFNESILNDSLLINNIILETSNTINKKQLSNNSFEITFNQITPNVQLSLSVNSLYDLNGNKSDTTLILTYLKDTNPPQISSAKTIDLEQIEVFFNEAINLDSITPTVFQLDNINSTGFEIINNRQLIIQFDNIKTNISQLFKISTLYDLENNLSQHLSQPVSLNTLQQHDVIISEILYDPISGINGEFIEIYNLTDRTVNTSELKIGKGFVDNNLPSIETIYTLQLPSRAIPPNTYLVLTNTTDWAETPTNAFNTKIPSLNNDGTTVILLNRFDEVIDYVTYNKDMHNFSIKDTKGISLEKIDLTIQNNQNNWTSASSLIESTPGETNSANHQFIFKNTLTIEPKMLDFNFGQTSILFSYEFENEKSGNCLLFNEKGQKIEDILVNEYLASQGIFNWSPTDSYNITTGTYVLVWETWDNTGNKKVEKYVISIIR